MGERERNREEKKKKRERTLVSNLETEWFWCLQGKSKKKVAVPLVIPEPVENPKTIK